MCMCIHLLQLQSFVLVSNQTTARINVRLDFQLNFGMRFLVSTKIQEHEWFRIFSHSEKLQLNRIKTGT